MANVTAGNWRSYIFSNTGTGTINLYRSATPFPRFVLTFNAAATPSFSIIQQNEQTGFLEGAPITSGVAFSQGAASFYIDVCSSSMVFYTGSNPTPSLGSFINAEFANITFVTGLSNTVYQKSIQAGCKSTVVCCNPCKSKCYSDCCNPCYDSCYKSCYNPCYNKCNRPCYNSCYDSCCYKKSGCCKSYYYGC